MSDDREKSLWPWIVALLIGLPVLYVASFGPACWWFSRIPDITPSPGYEIVPRASAAYFPIGYLAKHGPDSAKSVIAWYSTLFGCAAIALPADLDGDQMILFAPPYLDPSPSDIPSGLPVSDPE